MKCHFSLAILLWRNTLSNALSQSQTVCPPYVTNGWWVMPRSRSFTKLWFTKQVGKCRQNMSDEGVKQSQRTVPVRKQWSGFTQNERKQPKWFTQIDWKNCSKAFDIRSDLLLLNIVSQSSVIPRAGKYAFFLLKQLVIITSTRVLYSTHLLVSKSNAIWVDPVYQM